MKKLLVIITLLVIQLTSYTFETENKIFKSNDKKLKEFMLLKRQEIYDKRNFLDITLNNKGEKGELLFTRDNPNGTKFIFFNITEDYAENLLTMLGDYSKNEEYFDDFGFPIAEIFQVSCLDLNQDGQNEIILSAANSNSAIMSSYVWSKVKGSYKYIGEISGQYYMYYDSKNNSIIAPYGSFGLFIEYILKNDKIIRLEQ